MDALTQAQILTQNLTDAGCSEALIHLFLSLYGAGKERKALSLLAEHRRRLLDCCHAEERKIQCLDYLAYQIQQHQEEYRHGRKTGHDQRMG